MTVWETDAPGPEPASRFEGVSLPSLPGENGIAWYHEADTSTPTFVRPGELVDARWTAAPDAVGPTDEGVLAVDGLVGTDFNEGLDGVGPATAVDLVHEHGDLRGALDARGDHIEAADLVRELFLDPNVTDAEYDPDVRPDVDAAREFVVGEWGVPAEEVEAGFERIETAVTQTGLDRWT